MPYPDLCEHCRRLLRGDEPEVCRACEHRADYVLDDEPER